ncbi:MAG TPA: LPS-assembly protein LptD, partial [Nitrospinaceae bacterium]|nr:LPS-assembly protein LptD [Nitrospinaceae bacterium]
MNKHTGKAAATDAWLEFKGLPVLYTPYISFPLDDRRITGLLAPSFGNSEDNGYDTVIPYYWNIAPNYDLTVWARYMSKRGGMLSGDFRY